MFILPFIVFGIFFVVFLVIVLNIFKSHKHTGDTMQNMINTVSARMEHEIQKVFEQPKDETRICEYCGSTISANATQCEACGAKVSKKK